MFIHFHSTLSSDAHDVSPNKELLLVVVVIDLLIIEFHNLSFISEYLNWNSFNSIHVKLTNY